MTVREEPTFTPTSVRRVRLRVQGVPWMENYHGAEARLIGDAVDALEVTTANTVAFVDDRDGVATTLFEEWQEYEEACSRPEGRAKYEVNRSKARSAFREYARRRFLHGHVIGVRV